MRLVDTHCHLDLYAQPVQLADATGIAGIETIAVTNAPFVFPACRALVAQHACLRPAVGLHPQLVSEHGKQLSLLFEHLDSTRFVGEVGLDYSTDDEGERQLQRRVFAQILERCASHGDRLLTVHSRRASSDVLDMVGSGFPCAVVMHWFSGTMRDLDRGLSAGMYFSVNPAMVGSERGRSLVARIDKGRVLTESDGPFVSLKGRAATPKDTVLVLDHLAQQWECTRVDAARRVWDNYTRLVPEALPHDDK